VRLRYDDLDKLLENSQLLAKPPYVRSVEACSVSLVLQSEPQVCLLLPMEAKNQKLLG